MTRPFISIVTVSYNQANFLSACLQSIRSQKSSDVEYIVVDAGSTDGSRAIIDNFREGIDHLILEPDQGPADGLNKGFAQATGKIGYFLNSDDFLLPGAIGRMRRLWDAHSESDVLLGGAWMVDAQGHPLRELVALPVDLPVLLSGQGALVQQGMSFRLDRFAKIGGFRAENRTCWDYELLCDMLSDGAVPHFTRERLGAFRIYGGSLSGGVGGADHERRYLADLDRIHRKLVGRPANTHGPARTALNRLMRAIGRPSSSILYAWDRVFPAKLQERWRRDLTSDAVDR